MSDKLRERAEELLHSLFGYEADDPPSTLADIKKVAAFAAEQVAHARATTVPDNAPLHARVDTLVDAYIAKCDRVHQDGSSGEDYERDLIEPIVALVTEKVALARAETIAECGHKPLTYLAAPYSHPDRAVRIARFHAINSVAAELMRAGELVYSPISHTHPIAEAGDLPLGWDFWQKYDTAFIEHSKRVVVLQLDGWRESKGVTAEIKIAQSLGTPIDYIDEAIARLSPQPIQAHSKTEYKRLVVQGANVVPPADVVVVPIEPTKEMRERGEDELVRQYDESDWDDAKEVAEELDVNAIYKAMLATAAKAGE